MGCHTCTVKFQPSSPVVTPNLFSMVSLLFAKRKHGTDEPSANMTFESKSCFHLFTALNGLGKSKRAKKFPVHRKVKPFLQK